MLDLYRELFKKVEGGAGKIFSFLPLTPNQYTLISVIFVLFSCYFLIKQNLILAILFFLIAGFLDFVDGAMARYKNLVSKKGAYLDTIVDRYVEGILLLGMLFLPLPKILMPPAFWIFLILFGSLLTTYAKAAAKEKELTNQELRDGLLSRGERMILLFLALIFGVIDKSFVLMAQTLILIAFLTNFTAIQRIISALKLNP